MPLVTGDVNSDWLLGVGGILLVAGVLDYAMNSPFYFGGKAASRERKCVFVCSPLKPESGTEENMLKDMRENIRRAQWYCRQLYQKGLVPFASHVFYPYFLDDSNPLERRMGRKSALEFLEQLDAIYVYRRKKNS